VVTTSSERLRVGVVIEDEGPGIPEEVLEQVFEIGVQGPDAQPGHGLGLAIARRFCREHGGDVTAERRASSGSRFALWLPRASG
ncbi:MAG: ATP-binding protein, partial [Myxococcota bacterium]